MCEVTVTKPLPDPPADPGKAVCACGATKTSVYTSRGFIRVCYPCDGVMRWPQR
jgi:hypothetical protein